MSVAEHGAIARLNWADLDRGVDAYRRGDAGYFEVGAEDARSPGAKLCVQLAWFGYPRSVFTWDFTRELLERAGFERIRRCRYRQTDTPYPGITELDNRPRESLFAEARAGHASVQRAAP